MAWGENPAQPGSSPVPEVLTFTPAKQAQFLIELSKTGSIRGAAARIGMSRATIYRHAEGDETFRDDIDRARGDWEQAALETIAKAGEVGSVITRKNGSQVQEPGDWRAIAWLLEHNPAYRDAYAGVLRQKVELSGSDDLPPIQIAETIQHELGPDTMERLAKVVQVLMGAGKLRLPDPGEVKDVTPTDLDPDRSGIGDDTNGAG